jgi:hypothetical protein
MRLSHFVRAVVAVAVVLLAPTAGRGQIQPGQVDTFTDGTTAGWSQGFNSPNPPVVVPGGPGGPSDNFLRVTATGIGAGGRITIFNRAQWLGNYNAAGIVAIEMDLQAPDTNTQPLSMRIAYKVDAGQFSPGYVTTTPFVLPPDGQWYHATFTLTAAQMTAVGSPPPFADLMNGPGEMRILHSAGTVLNGDPINAIVGIDNIRASPVPEPAGLVVVAGVGWWLCRRRKGDAAGSTANPL